MEFKKIIVEVTADTKTVEEAIEIVAPFNNVVDTDSFTKLVQRRMLTIQRHDCVKAISAVKDCLLVGEFPTEAQQDRADNAEMILKKIDVLLAEACDIKHDSLIINILANNLLGKPYALGVANLDKMLREYHVSLVDSADKITIDGATQQKIITAIKKELKEILAVYSTEKDTIFKAWSVNINNRDVVNLCSWFYADITRDKTSGIFKGKYQTDSTSKVNYAPLQSYLQRYIFMKLQHTK